MDHVWNSLKRWEEIWEHDLKVEKESPDHEYKKHNIELISGQLKSIRIALKEIGKWV